MLAERLQAQEEPELTYGKLMERLLVVFVFLTLMSPLYSQKMSHTST